MKLMFRSLLPSLKLQIASAFTRDSIKGSIYVEAPSPLAVAEAVQGLSGILMHKGAVRLDLVALEDRIPLLESRAVPCSMKPGSWVQIKARGLYRGDVGIIRSLSDDMMEAFVLLIPRIRLDRKRKRGSSRPAQGLFDPKLISDVFGPSSLQETEPLIYKFRGDTYATDLLLADFPLWKLSDVGVHIPPSTVELLQHSKHPYAPNILECLLQKPEVGEKVTVIAGEYQSVLGRILAINNDDTIDMASENIPSYGTLTLPLWEVRKVVDLGSYVTVLYGAHKGLEGFLVAVEASVGTIFLYDVKDGQKDHSEVSPFTLFQITTQN